MREVFQNDESDAVTLVDNENALDTLNISVLLQNIQVLCPAVSTIAINTYRTPSCLILPGGIIELEASISVTKSLVKIMNTQSNCTDQDIDALTEQCLEPVLKTKQDILLSKKDLLESSMPEEQERLIAQANDKRA